MSLSDWIFGRLPPPAVKVLLQISYGGLTVKGLMAMAEASFPVNKTLTGKATFADKNGVEVTVDEIFSITVDPAEGVINLTSDLEIVDEDDVKAVNLTIEAVGEAKQSATITIEADANMGKGVTRLVGTATVTLTEDENQATSVVFTFSEPA